MFAIVCMLANAFSTGWPNESNKTREATATDAELLVCTYGMSTPAPKSASQVACTKCGDMHKGAKEHNGSAKHDIGGDTKHDEQVR